MSYLDALAREPWRFDLFAVLRRVERSFERANPERPRLGDGASRADEALALGDRVLAVALGQDPFLSFPDATISDVAVGPDRLDIRSRYLGFFGPQGALPLAVTEEAYQFLQARDRDFVRFLDLFAGRFHQLFFRAWADARPAAQHDRPAQDRFAAYVGSAVGLGSAPFRDLDAVPDLGKLAYAGLLAPQAKSAARLRRAITGLFGVRAEVDEFVGSWLAIEGPDTTRVGARNSRLGVETLMGRGVFSVGDKIRITVFVPNARQYARFLPGGDHCVQLADLVFFYVGCELDWEVELALPVGEIAPVQLGRAGALGWTSWMLRRGQGGTAWRRDAHVRPADRAGRGQGGAGGGARP